MHAQTNLESWDQVQEFIRRSDVDGHYYRNWGNLAAKIISDLKKLKLNENFRLGTAMFCLIFSTIDHYGLNEEPSVYLDIDPINLSARVAYCPRSDRPETWQEKIYSADDAGSAILECLQRLWAETKPHLPLPEAFRDQAGQSSK
jgi:hypothetical protein